LTTDDANNTNNANDKSIKRSSSPQIEEKPKKLKINGSPHGPGQASTSRNLEDKITETVKEEYRKAFGTTDINLSEMNEDMELLIIKLFKNKMQKIKKMANVKSVSSKVEFNFTNMHKINYILIYICIHFVSKKQMCTLKQICKIFIQNTSQSNTNS
jgi:hypothetical protein